MTKSIDKLNTAYNNRIYTGDFNAELGETQMDNG